MGHNGPVSEPRPRTPVFSLGAASRKRPPVTPARLAVGAALFSVCALGAWLTMPRPDVRVINASGQAVTVTVRGEGSAATRTLGVDRVWAVEQAFPAGPLRFQVRLPGRPGVSTALASPVLPLRVAIGEDGRVAPR
ncbi:hypothetical protein GCM10010840_13320 [Deinococcus aerolatus]|uniref:Uncharacterized protein n=1 Tax=Deinococcus aerolatus TaxID=522487 RepID=A0ABQ2G5P5_9DEIO|nr:hypothetical protein GCM10010840_13320 [Deinococcus aerolatus]